MKAMMRVMGMTIIGMLLMIIMIQTVNVDIRKDELESASSLAMNQTQQIMEEIIEDEYYGTNNARSSIDSNDEYFDLYVDNFQKLITTNCAYNIDLLHADYTKGLLDVNVTCRYKNFIGEESSITERKTNIIEQIDNKENIESYTIEYELNKGHVSGSNPTAYSKYSDADTLVLKAPTRTGYTFVGWTWTIDNETHDGEDGDGCNATNNSTPQKNVTININGKHNYKFVANWEAVIYNISYDYNDYEIVKGKEHKSTTPNNPTTYTIETPTFTLTNPEREHYIFKGWTIGTSTMPIVNPLKLTRGHTGTRHYVARWEEKAYTVTYIMNDAKQNNGSTYATNNAKNVATYTISQGDSNDNVTLYEPTRVGYIFQGWYDSTGKKITAIENASEGGNRTIYAKWQAKTITVTLSSNSENNATLVKQFTFDSDESTRKLGWPNEYFTSDQLRTGWDYNSVAWESGNTIQNDYIESVYNSNSTHSSIDRVQYTAKSVEFKLCNAYNSTCSTQTVYYDNSNWTNGQDVSLQNNSTGKRINTPIREGYIVSYWSTTQSGGNGSSVKAYDKAYEIYNSWILSMCGSNNKKTITLYAHWDFDLKYTLKNSSTSSNLSTWSSTYSRANTVVFTDQSFSGSYDDLSALSDGTVRGYLQGSTYYITTCKSGQSVYGNQYIGNLFGRLATNVNTINFNGKLNTGRLTISMGGFLSELPNLYYVYGLETLDTSKVTNMSGFFNSSYSLRSANISNLNTSKVTTFSYMFNGVTYLVTSNFNNGVVDCRSFDTRNTTDMGGMFAVTYNINYYYLNTFNTSKVTNMNGMFMHAIGAKAIYVGSGWTTVGATTTDMWERAGVKQVTRQ